MKAKIVSSALLTEEFNQVITTKVIISMKGEDSRLYPFELIFSEKNNDYLTKVLTSAGFTEPVTVENLKSLNGPVESCLDVKSLFILGFHNGRVTRLSKLG